MHTNAHIQYTNTNTEAPCPPCVKTARAGWCWLSVRGDRCLVNGDGWESEQSVGGQQVVRVQVPVGAGRAEGAKQGHQQFLTRRAAGHCPYGGACK